MLNTKQKEAVEYGHGKLMVIAGPGSGKTTVVTERIKYLTDEAKVSPESILVLTFSRAAACEMRERFLKTRPAGENCVTFGTFHSVFYNVLRKTYHGIAKEYIFADEEKDKARFDEMLLLTLELFKNRADILNSFKERYRWILIDEFQDIDDVQYEIIRLVADDCSNITVVGDDDQSIYGFRGAKPGIMMNFENDYSNVRKIILDTNYRSTSQIVEASSRLIMNNSMRFMKSYTSYRGKGKPIRVMKYDDALHEYKSIVSDIQDRISSGERPEDMAILYRTNIQPWSLKHMLDDYHISGINVMTFHKSKGLEFETVWILDTNEGITPHIKSETKEEKEEERRLFYVAMTRARSELYICFSDKVRGKKRRESNYIKELYM